ncbi:uncharacterized protein PV09_01347 [Verruconis gallopava]|uniref:Uncharacterized protein n=1 Tax=Verruconis gallopava TaxID=253628 RepID=A0A0D2BAY0_9PEZI|nr:uncharacterized protein PV09_01347 [Verruconis gallopava]KIW08444.1 hypothetical protein PV09_01347 [Verruconis gallopava]
MHLGTRVRRSFACIPSRMSPYFLGLFWGWGACVALSCRTGCLEVQTRAFFIPRPQPSTRSDLSSGSDVLVYTGIDALPQSGSPEKSYCLSSCHANISVNLREVSRDAF